MGQAAGAAAAMAAQTDGICRKIDVSRLQAILVQDGVYLGTDM